MPIDKDGKEYIIVHNDRDTKQIIDLIRNKGKVHDYFYNQINGKSFQENYNDSKRRIQAQREIEREIEKRVNAELEKKINEELPLLLEKKLNELLEGFNF